MPTIGKYIDMLNTEGMDVRDEVKIRLSIEDVIGRYLELKKSGRNFKALSPFTKEKTPSFIVSPEKQIWHDFSSGKGGDVFSFVMEVEGLDFRGALELLARQAGIDLEEYEKSANRPGISKSRLYELYELATKFYQVQFKANNVAREYVFKKRQFSKETALAWKLGYSPNTGDALISFLKNKGFSEKEMQIAGVAISSYKLNDMFRGRLMIPLADNQGRVIGFTARALEEGINPKYINTPQTVLYDKSRHVFGLHLAKEAIRTKGYAVIVEGNLDVISSHQIGVTQVVATAGTALTEQHLKAIGLLTKDIRLCFDADRAGLAATERAIPLASNQNLNISIINLTKGKDPDELIKEDKDLWPKVIENSEYAVDWLINYYKSNVDLKSAPGKRLFSDLILPIIFSLKDAVERDHYINQLASLLEVSPSALNQKLLTVKVGKPKAKLPLNITSEPIDAYAVEKIKILDNFLSLMLVRKSLRDHLDVLKKEMFTTETSRQLFEMLKDKPDLDVRKDLNIFKDLIDYVKIEVLLFEEIYSDLNRTELDYEAGRLKAKLVENYIKNQKAILTRELQSADKPTTRKLLEEVKKLDNLLNQVLVEGDLNAQE